MVGYKWKATVENGHQTVVKLLLEKGADVNVKDNETLKLLEKGASLESTQHFLDIT